MNRMYPYFDFHCDTLTSVYAKKTNLNTQDTMVNINYLKKYYPAVQTFAIYNDGSLLEEDILKIINFLKDECRVYSGIIKFAHSMTQIKSNISNKIVSAILSIESLGDQKDFNEQSLRLYYENGVRIAGLCHNHDNPLCGGIGENKNGLKPQGKLALRQMQSLGIILDVSHMSDKSFWEATEEYSLPFVATHSNSRDVCNNLRNLTDEQFICISKRGGLCGINFYPPFLTKEKADITSIIRHIEHFLSLGGENNICIGTDFDGIDKVPLGIENAGMVYKLFDALLSLNYNETLINKLAFNNFFNFFQKFEFFA